MKKYTYEQALELANISHNQSCRLKDIYNKIPELKKYCDDNGIELVTRTKEEKETIREICSEANQQNQDIHTDEEKVSTKGKGSLYCKCFLKKERNMLDNLKPQYISRLVFLATYISTEDNYLRFDVGNKDYIEFKNIIDLLRVSKMEAYRTMNAFEEAGYIIKDKKGYKVNREFFHRGKDLLRPLGEGERYTRLYHEHVRTLYRGVGEGAHKYLGFVYAMLYYVNINFNVLCWNPCEKDPHNIAPMTIEEFMGLLGLDKKNVNRVINSLNTLVFEFNRGREALLIRIKNVYDANKEKAIKDFVIVNPYVAYGGNRNVEGITTRDCCEYVLYWSENAVKYKYSQKQDW